MFTTIIRVIEIGAPANSTMFSNLPLPLFIVTWPVASASFWAYCMKLEWLAVELFQVEFPPTLVFPIISLHNAMRSMPHNFT